jgi:hypothetical protein
MVSFINHADGGAASDPEPDFEPKPVLPGMSEMSIGKMKKGKK